MGKSHCSSGSLLRKPAPGFDLQPEKALGPPTGGLQWWALLMDSITVMAIGILVPTIVAIITTILSLAP